MSQVKVEVKRAKRASWPVIGFILAVSFAILSYVLAPAAIDFVDNTLPQFSRAGMTPLQLRLAFALILFVIFISFAGLIITIAAPRKAINVKYSDLAKERDAINLEKKREQQRQRRLAQKMREDLKNRNK